MKNQIRNWKVETAKRCRPVESFGYVLMHQFYPGAAYHNAVNSSNPFKKCNQRCVLWFLS